MSQDYVDDCYDDDEYLYGEMDKMEKNFHAIKTNFSGLTEMSNVDPTVSVDPFMAWGDSDKKVFKFRNTDDDGWWGHMHGDEASIMYIYRDGSTLDGWVIDVSSGIQDSVIAVRGSSADTYDSGGEVAGNWDVNPESHNHKWYEESSGSNTLVNQDGYWADVVNELPNGDISLTALGSRAGIVATEYTSTYSFLGDAYTSLYGSSTWRPAAAVGTLQYLDLTS